MIPEIYFLYVQADHFHLMSCPHASPEINFMCAGRPGRDTSISYTNRDHIIGWIMSMGEKAQVLEPEDLAQEIREKQKKCWIVMNKTNNCLVHNGKKSRLPLGRFVWLVQS